jgi:hypothetical protein
MTDGPNSTESVELGNIALALDNHPRRTTPKLKSVGKDPDERFFMLATFCFDLSRKLKYVCLALREHWDDADPAFARRVLQDNERISPSEGTLSWEDMAQQAEAVMQALYQELQDAGFEESLRARARRAP